MKEKRSTLEEKYSQYILYKWKFVEKRAWVPWVDLLGDAALFVAQFCLPQADSSVRLCCILQFFISVWKLAQIY
jgi:hypothetical protein